MSIDLDKLDKAKDKMDKKQASLAEYMTPLCIEHVGKDELNFKGANRSIMVRKDTIKKGK